MNWDEKLAEAMGTKHGFRRPVRVYRDSRGRWLYTCRLCRPGHMSTSYLRHSTVMDWVVHHLRVRHAIACREE